MSLKGKEVWIQDCIIRHIDDLTASQLKVRSKLQEKVWKSRRKQPHAVGACTVPSGYRQRPAPHRVLRCMLPDILLAVIGRIGDAGGFAGA